MPKLKKCPFCGNTDLTGPWLSGFSREWFIRCWGDDDESYQVHNMIEFSETVNGEDKNPEKDAKARLIKKWNKRA